MRTDGGFHEDEEFAGFDAEGSGQGGNVPNPGVDLRGLDALEAPKVDGGPLGEIGLGQLPLQPEPLHVAATRTRVAFSRSSSTHLLYRPRGCPKTAYRPSFVDPGRLGA